MPRSKHQIIVLHDFRFAFRQLIKVPTFTAAAVLVLALGIGANTAIFGLMNTLLFQPPHYANPEEVVQLFSQNQKDTESFRGFSYPTYLDIRQQNSVFSGLAAHNLAMVGLGEMVTRGAHLPTWLARISSRSWESTNTRPSVPAGGGNARSRSPVAIVSYNYWKRKGLDPAVLGSTFGSMRGLIR